jgi:alpha-D-xyloside xylohydrolase
MDLYYRTEYQHGLSQDPEFVTLSRSMDRGYHPEGFAPIDAAPVCWVGDQEHKWLSEELLNSEDEEKIDIALEGVQGFESAIQNILRSAEKGYNIVGSDIGGFSGKVIPPRLYIRWAQFSTFCGLFLNGGHGERALWKRSPQELEIIRTYSWLHTELKPYIYSYVVQGHRGGRVLQQPVAGKYHYLFGDHLLIAPIYKDALENEVQLPPGKWRYWFADHELIEGGQTISRSFPLEEYPVFIREGAIIPMQIERAYTGLGDTLSRGYVTWLVYPDKDQTSAFSIYSTDEQQPTSLRTSFVDEELQLTFEGKHSPHILRIHLESQPQSLHLDGRELTDFEYDKDRQQLVIKTMDYLEGKYVIRF